MDRCKYLVTNTSPLAARLVLDMDGALDAIEERVSLVSVSVSV